MTLIQWILATLTALAALLFIVWLWAMRNYTVERDEPGKDADIAIQSIRDALRPGDDVEERASDFGALDTASNFEVSRRPRVRTVTTLPTIERHT